jgi:hypothetical protein
MEEQHFGVYVNNYVCTPEEWHRALSSPADKLPPLNDEQRARAKSFGVSEEDYSRGVLARLLAEQRMRERGRVLGGRVEAVLSDLGEGYRLVGVLAELNKDGWTIRVESPGGVVEFLIELSDADDFIDSLDTRQQGKLRVRVLSALGKDELLVNR